MEKDFGCPPPNGFGKVTTLTACDIDPHCRKVLKSLHEARPCIWESNCFGLLLLFLVFANCLPDTGTLILQAYRPDHIGFGLEDRIKPSVATNLRTVREKTLKEFESAKCDDLSFEMISCWSLVPMLIHCSVSNSLNIGWWPTGCFVRLHGGWLSGRASSTAIRIWRNAVRSLYENLDRWSWQLLAPTSLFCLQYSEEQEGYGLWDSEFQFRFVFVIHCDPVFICDVHLLYRSVWRLRDLRNHGLAQTQWDLGSSTGAESNSQQQEALVSIIVR